METPDLILLDGVKWLIVGNINDDFRAVEPICLKHNLRLKPQEDIRENRVSGRVYKVPPHESTKLLCNEENHIITLPRPLVREEEYIFDKLDAPKFAQMKVLNLDDEAIPVASEELKDTDYWVKAKVTKSKSGTRLIVWAGDKSAKNKTQLFVEPSVKRLSFDQNDDHPSEVFAKVEATFAGDVVTTIERVGKKSTSEDEKSHK